jgi:intracellular sulfur oxidation DsrE/DsrF family protein
MQRFILAVLFLSLGCLFTNAQADKLNDTAALSGLHDANAVFLVNMRNPAAVDHLVRVIGLTRNQLLQQKVTPHFIVVFIGPDVAFLTKDRRGIPYTEERDIAGIQGEIQKLSQKGIQFQACGVALHGMDVSPSMLIPSVTPVESGFISTIAYQEKGYALVPVY